MGTRVTMDYKSIILIFGATMIFILPVVMSCIAQSREVEGYQHLAYKRCDGRQFRRIDNLKAFQKKKTFQEATNACNMDSSCDCFHKYIDGNYYLFKGTQLLLLPFHIILLGSRITSWSNRR